MYVSSYLILIYCHTNLVNYSLLLLNYLCHMECYRIVGYSVFNQTTEKKEQ